MKTAALHVIALGFLVYGTGTGDAWIALIAAVLFVWTWFPQWRGRVYRLLDRGVSHAIKAFGRDTRGPE